MHGKYFETDESIARSYNTIHRPTWWVDKSDELIFLFLVFFLGKIAFYLLVFCSLQRDSAQIIWWNYFLNNFSLLDGLLRLVCLLMVYSYFIMIIDQQDVGNFLMTHVLQQQSLILHHMEYQWISSFEHLYFSLSADVFTYQLNSSLFRPLNLLSCIS